MKSRHLWTVLVVMAAGIGYVTGGPAWAQPAGPTSTADRDSQKTAADFVNNGHGSVSPSVTRDLVHVPMLTGGKPPPGVPAGRAVAPEPTDPGTWDEKPWVSWWETNRDAVLKRILARRAAQPQITDNRPPAERARAVAALLKATHAERPDLRAAAAVSLGQVRQVDALPRLVEMGQKDPDAYVRGMAWLAVGLIGTADAEKALVAVKPRDEFEQLGVIAGIGMLPQPTEATFKGLRGLIAQPPSPEIGRAAAWALRVFHRPADHDLLLAAAAPSNAASPIRSEALLGLGVIADARDVMFLADAATDGRASTAPDQSVLDGGGGSARRSGTYQYPEPPATGGGVAPAGGRSTTMLRRQPRPAQTAAVTGPNAVPRVSAALALGPNGDTGKPLASGNVKVENALVQNFAPYLDQGGPIFGGASVIAFAVSAAPKDLVIVRDILDMGTDPAIGLVNPKSPLRGYAALALGLSMAAGGPSKIATHPPGVVQVGPDIGVPDYVDLNEILAQRYTNKQESSDLRAACALALGLSGDPANVQRLLAGADRIDRRDDMLLGYTALALAVLNEKSAFNAASPLVSGGAAKLDVEAIATRGVGHLWPVPLTPKTSSAMSEPSPFDAPPVPLTAQGTMGVLGRRAALLAMAILNDPRSEATLTGAWGRDGTTVQDVARTMQWCRAYKPADALSQLVERDQKGAVEAAMSLGWEFDPDRPSRLSRLVVGNNYHTPQYDWMDRGGSDWMVRNFARVGDLYLYSGQIGGKPLKTVRTSANGPTTRPGR